MTTTSRTESILKGILIVSQPLDVWITTYALLYVRGACEMNPLLQWIVAAQFSVLALIFFLMLKLGLALKIHSGRVESPSDWAFLWVASLVYAGVVAWNASCVMAVTFW